MQQPDFEQAVRYAFERLEHELDTRLRYHSLAHTRDDVLPAVERLAAHAGVNGEPLLLLRTAAAYHDLGFLVAREAHEAAGVAMAVGILPGFGYSSAQIATIGELIMATRMPQTPATPLAQFLADADLDLLGRNDFFALNQLLRDELQFFGDTSSDADWYRSQITFLANHRYWTETARDLRNAGKETNLELLRKKAAQCMQ